MCPPEVTYFAYPQDKTLCVVETLNSYIQAMGSFRTGQEYSQLLLGVCKPHKPVVSCTISGWIKKVLEKSGINTETFKGHSTRAASSTKASLSGASIDVLLKRGSWSTKSTWQKHYNKNMIKKGQTFQDSI